MTKRIKIAAVVAALLAAGAAVFASGSGEAAPAKGPVPIKVFRGGVTIDWEKDPVILALNEKLGIKLSFVTANWNEVAQKRNLLLTSGEEIDVLNHMGDLEWIQNKVVIGLDPFLSKDKTPYLFKLVNSTTFAPLKYEGKAYYVPMIAHGSDYGFAVRADWLKKLNLSVPKNEQEFYQMLKAFKAMDPTGTTVGLQLEGAAQIRRTTIPILTAFGVPTSPWDQVVNFTIKDGKLSHIATMPNLKAAMAYLNKLYLEGLINSDFPQMDSFPKLMEKWFRTGKSGAGWIQNPLENTAFVQKVDPAGEVGLIPPFSATGYKFERATGLIVNGQTAIGATSKSPAKAIEFLEYINSEDGRKLFTAGVPGKHYGAFGADGYFSRNDEAWKADYGDSRTYPLYFYVGQGLMHGYIPAKDYATFEEAYGKIRMYDPESLRSSKVNFHATIPMAAEWVGTPNPFQFLTFPDLKDQRTAINDVIVQGWTKLIAAEAGKFDAVWEKYLKDLDAAGLPAWLSAYQKYYDANLKK